MRAYSQEFYATRHERTAYAANAVLETALSCLPVIDSAIDIGCGVGTWLAVLRDQNVREIRGIDGDWVDRGALTIPAECFEYADLTKPIPVDRRYDLAISLEVAEHLPPERAESFVRMLTQFSDFVLFSAAIPRQGGRNHLNERWQKYWVDQFESNQYVAHDIIRPAIWYDTRIPFWYRQNILLFSARHRASEIGPIFSGNGRSGFPYDVVHPAFLNQRLGQYETVKGSFLLFFQCLRQYLSTKLGQK